MANNGLQWFVSPTSFFPLPICILPHLPPNPPLKLIKKLLNLLGSLHLPFLLLCKMKIKYG